MKRLKVISDSEFGKWRDELDLPTTPEQDRDCLLLEEMGQRFLVDYGYENAAQKLAEARAKLLDAIAEGGIDGH